MRKNPLPRLDSSPELRERLLPYCRLSPGEIWTDDVRGHRVGCLDATDRHAVQNLMGNESAQLAVQDPPYNLAAFERRSITAYIDWCRRWVELTVAALAPDASLYVWLGADQNDGFQPLPDFMLMMRGQPFRSRSLVTMRNQRGYGTPKKLDGSPPRIAVLRQRQSRFLGGSGVYRHPQKFYAGITRK